MNLYRLLLGIAALAAAALSVVGTVPDQRTIAVLHARPAAAPALLQHSGGGGSSARTTPLRETTPAFPSAPAADQSHRLMKPFRPVLPWWFHRRHLAAPELTAA